MTLGININSFPYREKKYHLCMLKEILRYIKRPIWAILGLRGRHIKKQLIYGKA